MISGVYFVDECFISFINLEIYIIFRRGFRNSRSFGDGMALFLLVFVYEV